MKQSSELRATIADAADTLVAAHFTEVQLRQRAADWQKAAPDADLAQQTAFMLQESRAFTEELLAAVLEKCLTK
ncbi:hypothetical protein [Lacticaseibacillus kribbianus]|uniref:hypothetical protein n=1 Tax=Lacticaseibacillus kribbianus TaxID=2926292 RepID=UPI001CD7C91C|nr:hypothetical protein [Lacticaseibacillus kribbianus]